MNHRVEQSSHCGDILIIL